MARKKQRVSITRKIMNDAYNSVLVKIPHDLSRKLTTRNFKAFVLYCRNNYNVKNLDECRRYIQNYCDWLVDKNYTASSIHTYVSAICKVLNVPLSNINKPIRYTSENKRGRHPENGIYSRNNLNDKKHEHLVKFQRAVGIRRAELAKLTGSDFVEDESGNYCVRVKNGKGGKLQLQRILEKDIPFVKSYFDGKNQNEKIFSKSELSNDLNLHYLRSKSAKCFYNEIVKKCNENPEYRQTLEQEVIARWNKYNINPETKKPRYLAQEKLNGYIYLRGRQRKFALDNDRPIVYDRLCVLATSIFKLSHWRTGVAINNYLNI